MPKRRTLLLVEDNDDDVLLLQAMIAELEQQRLNPSHFHLQVVPDLETAKSRCGADIDAVLLDLTLPDSRGPDTAAAFMRHAADLPVIILTGINDAELALQLVKQGAQDYLVKGHFDSTLLQRSVHYAIERFDILRDQQRLVNQLQTALKEIKTLSGLLPICAGCKKIRNDRGYWERIESYIQKHSNAEFTHGLCPACQQRYYPGFDPDAPEDEA